HGDQDLDSSIRSAGFSRKDITDVFLTHLHFDHCGGAINREGDRFLPAFPNAVYWSNALHWKWATEPNEREKASFLKENILPIKESGLLKMVSMNEDRDAGLLPRFDFEKLFDIRVVNGHTEAMMLP